MCSFWLWKQGLYSNMAGAQIDYCATARGLYVAHTGNGQTAQKATQYEVTQYVRIQ